MIFESAFIEYIKTAKEDSIYYVDSKTVRKGNSFVKFIYNGNTFELVFSKSILNWVGLIFIMFKNILIKGVLDDDGEKFILTYESNETKLKITKPYRPDYKGDDSLAFLNSIREFKNTHLSNFYKILFMAIPIVLAETIFLVSFRLFTVLKRKFILKASKIKREKE